MASVTPDVAKPLTTVSTTMVKQTNVLFGIRVKPDPRKHKDIYGRFDDDGILKLMSHNKTRFGGLETAGVLSLSLDAITPLAHLQPFFAAFQSKRERTRKFRMIINDYVASEVPSNYHTLNPEQRAQIDVSRMRQIISKHPGQKDAPPGVIGAGAVPLAAYSSTPSHSSLFSKPIQQAAVAGAVAGGSEAFTMGKEGEEVSDEGIERNNEEAAAVNKAAPIAKEKLPAVEEVSFVKDATPVVEEQFPTVQEASSIAKEKSPSIEESNMDQSSPSVAVTAIALGEFTSSEKENEGGSKNFKNDSINGLSALCITGAVSSENPIIVGKESEDITDAETARIPSNLPTSAGMSTEDIGSQRSEESRADDHDRMRRKTDRSASVSVHSVSAYFEGIHQNRLIIGDQVFTLQHPLDDWGNTWCHPLNGGCTEMRGGRPWLMARYVCGGEAQPQPTFERHQEGKESVEFTMSLGGRAVWVLDRQPIQIDGLSYVIFDVALKPFRG